MAEIEILLVEDNSADITSALNTLKKANVFNRVRVLRQADLVMDFLSRSGVYRKERPLPQETLVMLSLNLSGVHGLDILRKMKADERTRSFPVIMVTASQEQRGIMQSYKLGANSCIVKPIDFPKFADAVSELRLGWVLISGEELDPANQSEALEKRSH
jgi:two-component system, response regulator